MKVVASRQLIYIFDLLYELVLRDLKIRYKRSVIGLGWSLLNPLAQLLVFYFVFGVLLPVGVPNFLPFLMIGILVWNFFQTGLLQTTTVIVENPNLIRQPGFPIAILPVVSVTSQLVHFIIAWPILFFFLFLDGTWITPSVLALPAVVLFQYLLILSIAYWTAAFQVKFRDTQYLLSIALMFGIFLSGIFFDISSISSEYQTYLYLNPMVHVLNAYRAILLHGWFPDFLDLAVVGLLMVSLLWFGLKHFINTSYRFVEEL